jgi:hypothetical protein
MRLGGGGEGHGQRRLAWLFKMPAQLELRGRASNPHYLGRMTASMT